MPWPPDPAPPLNRHAIAALAVCAALLAWEGGALAQPPHARARTAAQGTDDFASLVASRSATVVEIHTLRGGRDAREREAGNDTEFMPDGEFADRLAWPLPAAAPLAQVRDLASGLIVASDGLVMTSAHVVSGADEAQVRLADGRRFAARLVGSDPRSDIALLRIDARGLPAAAIGEPSRLRAGDWVASIGAPFGFRGSVTSGVVSAKDRFIAGAGDVPYIQTDVAINPGSSGSPLFNRRGEVVAINSMIYTGSGGYMGVSFAVPIDLAMRSMAQLLATGGMQRARLGAQLQEMTPPLAQSFGLAQAAGALVAKVEPGGAADRAGLAMGDVLTAIDGQEMTGLTDVLHRIDSRTPGTSSSVGYWRQGVARSTRVLWSRDGGAAGRPADAAREQRPWHDGLGLLLGELPPGRREQLQLEDGLLVRESAGAARSEGIRAGDVVLAVNEQRVARVEDFREALARQPAGRPVALLVMRDRRLTYVPVATGSPSPLRP